MSMADNYTQTPGAATRRRTANVSFSNYARAFTRQKWFWLFPDQNQESGWVMPREQQCDIVAGSSMSSPFPFLRLSPELRNKVYEYALRTPKCRPWSWTNDYRYIFWVSAARRRWKMASWIGLNAVCRQIRAEFRPLFYRSKQLMISICDMHQFLETFFPRAGGNIPFLETKITVSTQEACAAAGWNMLPLLQAAAHNPYAKWVFGGGVHWEWNFQFHAPSWTMRNGHDFVCASLNSALNIPRASFFRDIKSNLFLAIDLCRVGRFYHDGGWDWMLVVQKTTGRLDKREKRNMKAYCEALAICTPWRTANRPLRPCMRRMDNLVIDIVGAKVLAVSAEGKLTEMYVGLAAIVNDGG
ncbi:hypothetical protein BKA66DRAFT_139647 [Pyrenochaeta sp. MPI-SDFR-AT-0127]|nr:hypothetical protein BKA66DRAFT_139647 [Pyrenochaeta sp. MPI-SDFR-AT-0127]